MLLSGRFLVPVSSPPVLDAAILIKGGRIRAVGQREALRRQYPAEETRDYPNGIILPGLINLHAHLEYTLLGCLQKPTPFLSWLESLIGRSKELKRKDWEESYRRGIDELKKCGVTTVVDIARWGVGLDDLIASGLRSIYCIEFVAIDDTELSPAGEELNGSLRYALMKTEGTKVQVGLAPHSVYTLSKNALSFVGQLAREKNLFLTIHLAESRAESELIMEGRGSLRDFLSHYQLNTVPPEGFRISPAAYLHECGLMNKRVVISHGVWVDEGDLSLLQGKSAGIALCVRSNYYLENGTAPFEKMKRSGLHFGFGTDSLAGNASLDLFEELRFFKSRYQGFSAEELLKRVTVTSAEILGMGEEIGSIEEGKSADLVVMECRKTIPSSQVYQYLIDEGSGEDVLISLVDGRVIFERGEA